MSSLLNKLKRYSGLDKAEFLMKIVKHNGGWKESLGKLYRNDDLKIGTLIGEDSFGNKYYENPYYFVPRNRWVEFNKEVGLEYNASQITPEWHRWLTHMTEYPPTVEKPVNHKWMLPHQENLSGCSESYVPYSTVKPKIQSWKP